MNYKLFTIILTAFILLNLNLGKWGIMETSEARYAEISKEMIENHDYIHPKLLGIYHYHKPPITYQITALGYKIFGINEFGARFFVQLAIIIQLILVYQISLILFNNKKIALTSCLIYFSLPIVLISSRNLTTDAYLNTFILASIFSWLSWKIRNHKILFLYLFYFFLGIGFEIKGPVSLLFPFIFVLIYKIINKEKPRVTIHHILGILLFFLVASAWYLVVVSENQKLWNYFFKDQIVKRIASKSYNRSKPFWFYLLTIPLIGLPWIFIMLHYLKTEIKRLSKTKNIELVLYLTILSLIIIFSIFKTKLILYVLPLFGFVSIASAKALSVVSKKSLRVYNKSILALIFLFLFGLIGCKFLDFNIELDTFRVVSITIVSLVIIIIVLQKSFQDQYIKTAVLGFIFGCIVLVSGTQFLIQNENLLNCPKKAIQFIDNELEEVDNILVYNYLLSSVNFYSDKNVVTLNNGHNTVQRETQFETSTDWKKNLIDLKTPSGQEQTKKLIRKNSVLLARKRVKFRDDLRFIEEVLKHKKEFGKWVVYY